MRKRFYCIAAILVPAASVAQTHEHEPTRRWSFDLGGQALLVGTHASPADRGRDLTEAYLTQPNIFLHAARGGLSARVTLNLEGLTLRRGELNAGAWGEGYIDRRHPHTYLHEAMLTARGGLGDGEWSVSAGKGFVPFGTDDPMSRPFLKFPANHHLSQVLERLVVIGAIRYGPVLLEGSRFNGDEPSGPKSLGTLERMHDSWSTRLTLRPFEGSELQVSRSRLESPEQPAGSALDQDKWNVALRYARTHESGERYGLLEWARTAQVHDGMEVVALHSLLAEGSVREGKNRLGVRFERTVRPEEERAGSIFRSPWPHADERIWGLTRWIIASANASHELNWKGLHVVPVVEVARQWAKPTLEPAIFSPEQLYGSDRLWSLSLALRLSAGKTHARMGRYGPAR